MLDNTTALSLFFPKFFLPVQRAEGTLIRNGVELDDLTILETFLKGDRAWGMDNENDLKKDIPSIRKKGEPRRIPEFPL